MSEKGIRLIETKVIGCTVEGVVIDLRTRDWCKLRYPGHPKGCPAYGRPWCPPNSPILTDYMEPQFIVACKFDLMGWMLKWHHLHSGDTVKQCKDSIFWQGNARKQIDAEIEKVKEINPRLISTNPRAYPGSPEACGVNVFETMKRYGIRMETPRAERFESCLYVWLVAILGYRKA